MNINIKNIKKDFPILKQRINKKRLIYLDNATTTQKPKQIIKYLNYIYKHTYASPHRGIYNLTNNITNQIEHVRYKIAKFINANSPEEIIFTNNTTTAINFIINSWGKKHLTYKNNIILSITEHHSNLIPWYQLKKDIGYEIKLITIKDNGSINIDHLKSLINRKTKLIAITHISNILGIINPIQKILQITKKYHITSLIDGTQAIAHINIDVQKLNCDFYIFSSHKIYAPTGTGIIYSKKKILKTLDPWIYGGGIITNLNIKKNNISHINIINSPWKFEAGTPNIESILSLGIAIDYINNIGIKNIMKYEYKLITYTINKIKQIPNIQLFGMSKRRIGILSFNINNYHCYDIGILLNKYGISIRTGHQCCLPLMKYYNVPGMCRISLAIYNSKKDINILISSLHKIINLLT